jgi:hypothetical protein
VTVWRTDPEVLMPDPFELSISRPSVMHHPGYGRTRACSCGHYQFAQYGITMPPDTHICTTEDGTRRIVHWKRT